MVYETPVVQDISKNYTLSEIVKMFENAFNFLNKEYFENTLSKSVITIQSTPRAYGHFSCEKIWNISDDGCAHEINLGAETLDRHIENVIATLLHEMVHQYCSENRIADTSRGKTYHNKNFKIEAEKRGLIIEYDKKIGWSITSPSEELKRFISINNVFQEIALCRNTRNKKVQKKSSTRKYICPCCNQSVRATKEVFVKCGICEKTMILEKATKKQC